MRSVLKTQKGQVMVEFAIAMIIFMLFVFALFAFGMWGAASFFTQEIAHEVARKYAVTDSVTQAESAGKGLMGRMAYVFIKPETIQIEVRKEGTSAVSEIKAKPRIDKYFVFHMPYITKTSEATLEHYIREGSKDQYVGRY
jgi:predicted metalloprotease